MWPLTMVVQNQSDWMHADNGDSEAMIAPTVVFPAPGGPVRISIIPSSMPRRYSLAPGLGRVPFITGRMALIRPSEIFEPFGGHERLQIGRIDFQSSQKDRNARGDAD
jgi:hypothetical protein